MAGEEGGGFGGQGGAVRLHELGEYTAVEAAEDGNAGKESQLRGGDHIVAHFRLCGRGPGWAAGVSPWASG